MQRNLETAKAAKEKRAAVDHGTNHLINPMEFQLMDQKEAIRNLKARQQKKLDD